MQNLNDTCSAVSKKKFIDKRADLLISKLNCSVLTWLLLWRTSRCTKDFLKATAELMLVRVCAASSYLYSHASATQLMGAFT